MNSIYLIENKVNGKKYIGKTNNPLKRCREHFLKSHNIHLRYAIEKYGVENFEFNVLQNNLDDILVNEAEKYYINEHRSFIDGYNMTPGGEGGNTLLNSEIAKKHSKATSDAMRGKKRKPFTSEHKKKLAKILKDNNGSVVNSKPLLAENQFFQSQHEASRILGVSQATINYRLKTGKPGYKYLNKTEI